MIITAALSVALVGCLWKINRQQRHMKWAKDLADTQERYIETIEKDRRKIAAERDMTMSANKAIHGVNKELQAKFDRLQADNVDWMHRHSECIADALAWRKHKARMAEIGRKGALAGHAKRKAKQAETTEKLKTEAQVVPSTYFDPQTITAKNCLEGFDKPF